MYRKAGLAEMTKEPQCLKNRQREPARQGNKKRPLSERAPAFHEF
jgi:hypothetical protein